MSGIVLSASVRQNLLSLQSTAQLLATTQNNLSTGKKVNSALDNPTNFFTAQGLDNRASDISNLLDGIGNGVQVLQSANTGITSLQKLVDSAKSIANQVLQSAVGYSTKSNVTSAALTGATTTSLIGAGSTAVTGSVVLNDNASSAVAITGSTKLSGTPSTSSNDLASSITTGDTLVVNGTTFTF
ncbi:MAG: flagellar protein, partial [Bradyrhizobium sp.]|nr:flagellar protein [Bradyrhizobium sp.]